MDSNMMWNQTVESKFNTYDDYPSSTLLTVKSNLDRPMDLFVQQLVDLAIAEDNGKLGDITSCATVEVNQHSEAYFIAKADGVLAGLQIAEQIFNKFDNTIDIKWTQVNGDYVTKGTRFGTVYGPLRSILSAERIALNLMQRMGGIATQTRKMVNEIKRVGSKTLLLDTRKTALGHRFVDKLAVRLGGGVSHRFGLHDMVMIKDNHIVAAGGPDVAIQKARKYLKENAIEAQVMIEAETMEQVQTILNIGGVDRIMLDNMVTVENGKTNTSLLESALELIDGQVQTEASGNITLQTVADVAKTGVDFVSTGSITHSVIALDISLKKIHL